MTRALTAAGFLACILAANYVTTEYGMVPVGFGLVATAGTYFAGLSFVLRDAVQDAAGKWVVLTLIVVGAGLSFAISAPFIALASGAAFLASETADLLVLPPCGDVATSVQLWHPTSSGRWLTHSYSSGLQASQSPTPSLGRWSAGRRDCRSSRTCGCLPHQPKGRDRMNEYEVHTEFGRYDVKANDWQITESGALAFYARTKGSSRELVRVFSSFVSAKRLNA